MTWLTTFTAGLEFDVALVEVRLGSVYHMALALGLTGLVVYSARTPSRNQGVRVVLGYGLDFLEQTSIKACSSSFSGRYSLQAMTGFYASVAAGTPCGWLPWPGGPRFLRLPRL